MIATALCPRWAVNSAERLDVRDDRLLTPGQTCWRVERADQFACVIDAADYFKHVKAVMLRAQHRIMLIGWDFDARMTFERGVKSLPGPNQLGAFDFAVSRRNLHQGRGCAASTALVQKSG